jgi:hypothetical protein
MPQAAGPVPGYGPRRPPGFDVARQQAQDLAEGQVRVADAGVGVAVPAGHDQVGVGRLGAPGEFPDQGRLALTSVAGDENHLTLSGQRLVKEPLQLRQFALPGHKDGPFNLNRLFAGEERRKGHWQVFPPPWLPCLHPQFPVADPLVQLGRLLCRTDAQLFGQDAAAGFILGQGRPPLTPVGQQPHHLLVGLLPPGLQLQQTPGKAQALLVLPTPTVVRDQFPQHPGHPLTPALALCHQPEFELGTVVQVHPFQEFPAIQLRGGGQRSGIALGFQFLCPSARSRSVSVKAARGSRAAL